LRPGEKLYEELLIDSAEADTTHHPRVFKARETHLPWSVLQTLLNDLSHACHQYNMPAIYRILGEYVQGYKPSAQSHVSASNVVSLPNKHDKASKPLAMSVEG
jgi:FlaA1/EpsC-like NDP-sugar epimerase